MIRHLIELLRGGRPGLVPTQPAPAPPWEWLRPHDPSAAALLDRLWPTEEMSDVDRARLATALDQAADDEALRAELIAELHELGPAAASHNSGQRDLPGERRAEHNLATGQVRLGRLAADARNVRTIGSGHFGVDTDCLRTSLLVVGPPGCGKTHGVAVPIAEHLVLQSLANRASVLVIDPKGDDFDFEGWFDHTIDPTDPDTGFDLYGGASTPEEAADQLSSALLPAGVSADKQYFMDASRNTIYACLDLAWKTVQRWPSLQELLRLMRMDEGDKQTVNNFVGGKAADTPAGKEFIARRRRQAAGKVDPAASAAERLSLLDRPNLHRLFDPPKKEHKFSMGDINRPIRVRLALPEARMPETTRILARLAMAQFTHVTSSPETNRGIFKGLLVEEAGRFIDDYTARALQRVRSNNAGLVLLTQSLGDFPDELLPTVFTSAGGKFVFPGIDPDGAEQFSRFWGEQEVSEFTRTRTRSASTSYDNWNLPTGRTKSQSIGVQHSKRMEALWSPGELSAEIPLGHCVAQLSRSNGVRTPPVLVNLREKGN